MKTQICSSCKTIFTDKTWIDSCPICRGKRFTRDGIKDPTTRNPSARKGPLYPHVTKSQRKPTRADVKITVWEERDRLHIGIVDKATEQKSYADWWDDDARQMFEDGFFKPGIIYRSLDQIADAKLTNSVLEYAEDMGILSK